MSGSTSRRRMLASGLLVAAVAGLVSAPVSAGAGTGKCIWYDADIPPSGGAVPLQDCGLHSAQTPEATYYWSDEARVIIEPRALAFDYSAFGGLDPFGSEYSFRKANELFPDTSRLADAYAKANYARLAMSTKARALGARRGLSGNDGCNAVPALWSDRDIREAEGFLAPSPTPDSSTGTYTYSLASNLTAEQRVAVIAGLTVFEEARAGSLQPRLVEWQPGSEKPPVITFNNVPEGFDDNRDAEAAGVTWDKGRDGLDRWVNGNINLSPTPGLLDGWIVAHEILHVYGFAHNPFATDEEVMSLSSAPASWYAPWRLDVDSTPVVHSKLDACTKEGLQNAPAPK